MLKVLVLKGLVSTGPVLTGLVLTELVLKGPMMPKTPTVRTNSTFRHPLH